MLSKLKLYGELAEFCGGQNEFEAVINRPIDAVRFLRSNFADRQTYVRSVYRAYMGDSI